MKISQTQFAKLRNKEFLANAIPVLESIGFTKCPMGKPYWGSEPHGGFQCDFCRLRSGSILELLTVYIIRPRNRRFQIIYNQVEIAPPAADAGELRHIDDMPFRLPSASVTQMEIPPARWLGLPFWPRPYMISRWRLWLGVGIQQAIGSEVGRMIEDFRSFDRFVTYWEQSRTRVRLNLTFVPK